MSADTPTPAPAAAADVAPDALAPDAAAPDAAAPAETTAAPAPRRSLIHHPDFRRLWAGDALGQLGAQLTMLALPIFAVQHLRATAWQMGALGASETLAFLVIGLPTGAWVDRMRKRNVLINAALVRGLTLAVVVVAAFTGHASMPLLYAAALVISVASTFFDVAHQSYVPGLVGLEHIVEGNSKLQATQSVAMVVAPAIGGGGPPGGAGPPPPPASARTPPASPLP